MINIFTRQCVIAKHFNGLLSIGIPTNGFSSLTDKLQQKQEKQQQEEYKKEIDFLASKPHFTLVDYRQRIIDSIAKLKKGIRAKVSADSEQNEAQLVQQRQIMNAMMDSELLNPSSLTGEKKKEIGMVAQVKTEEVNLLIKNFQHMANLHKWIREQKERGEVLPANQEELMYKFRKDKPIPKSYLKFEYRKPKYSKKQREQVIKWGYKAVQK